MLVVPFVLYLSNYFLLFTNVFMYIPFVAIQFLEIAAAVVGLVLCFKTMDSRKKFGRLLFVWSVIQVVFVSVGPLMVALLALILTGGFTHSAVY